MLAVVVVEGNMAVYAYTHYYSARHDRMSIPRNMCNLSTKMIHGVKLKNSTMSPVGARQPDRERASRNLKQKTEASSRILTL